MQPFVFIYIRIRNPCVSVYFVKTTPLKFHPIYFCVVVVVVFFCRSQGQSRRKVESLCFFLKQQTHASTGDLHFSKEQGSRALWTMWGLSLKDSRGVLGTSFRFGPTSEILENIQYGGSSVVKTDSQRSRFIAREA